MANFTALKTAINNAIKTNGNEEITGAILQAILDAMVETLGDSAINDLENAITTEVTNRENAVGGVAEDLTAEALARANKDNQLDGRINQEEYNRQNADAALSRTVDQGFQTLNSQMTALNAAISALNAAYQNGFLYGGVVTPSSSPANGKCFYIALQGGTYTNFGGVGVVQGINILKNDNGWKVEHIYDQTTLLNEFYLLRQQVIQAITSFAPIVIEGDVTNAPDEEDLTSNAQHLLQFKNNAYSPLEFSGLGRKYLRKNIAPLSESAAFNGFVESVTAEETLSGTPEYIFWDRMNTRFVGIKDGVYYADWTGSENYVPASTSLVYMYQGTPYRWDGSNFSVDETEVPNLVNCLTQDMINEANTIYIIRYDYTLKEDITIPANCILEFDGGSISGAYTITGQNTGIESGLVKIFDVNTIFDGTWNITAIYPEWFGAEIDSTDSAIMRINSDSISKCLNFKEQIVVSLSCGTYYIIPDIEIRNKFVKLQGNKSIVKTKTDTPYRAFIYADSSFCKDLTIENILFSNLEDTIEISTPIISGPGINILYVSANNLTVKNCDFYFYGGHALISLAASGEFVNIHNNRIFFQRHGTSVDYDCSGMYIDCRNQSITNNFVNGKPDSGNNLRGGIESHGDKFIVSDNTFFNCGTALHTLSTTVPVTTTDGNEPKLIVNNIFNECVCGVQIWQGYNPFNNLQISNNVFNVYRNAIGCHTTVDGDYEVCNLLISNNIIKSITDTKFYAFSDTDMSLISLHTYSFNNCNIVNNIIDNGVYYGILLSTSHSGENKNAKIIDNTIKDCGCVNSDIYLDLPVIKNKNESVILDGVENCLFNNNSFIFDKSIQFHQYLIRVTGTSKNVIVTNNNVHCNYVDTSAQYVYEEDTHRCMFEDLSVVKTDIPEYADEYRESYPDSFLYRGLLKAAGYVGSYHVGDTQIQNDCELIFNEASTNKPIGSSGYIYEYRFESYTAIAGVLKVGDSIKIENAIGGFDKRHTIIKKYGFRFNFVTGEKLRDPNVTPSSSAGNVANYITSKIKYNNFITSGIFSEKPTNIPIGFKYFCTDRQTTEGATNGIEIIHKGNNVWVDALGRVVS